MSVRLLVLAGLAVVLMGVPPLSAMAAAQPLAPDRVAPSLAVPPALAPAVISPVDVVDYVPINITNNQSVATPAPFDLQLSVNSSAYAPLEAGNLSNVEFFGSNGSIVPSWLESGDSNSSNATTYWLNLSGGIPATSSVTLYLGFGRPGDFLLNNVSTGEAPQLSASGNPYSPGSTGYGEFDDGAAVFPFYQDFQNVDPGQAPRVDDSTPPPGWYSSPPTHTGYCNYPFNGANGWEANGVNGCGVVFIGSDFPVNGNLTIDIDVDWVQTVTPNWQAPFVVSSSPTSYVPTGNFALEWDDYSMASCNTFGYGSSFDAKTGPGGTTRHSFGTVYTPFVLTVNASQVAMNYSTIYTPSGGTFNRSGYLAMAVHTSNYCGSRVGGWWVRERAPPPNGVMPSASWGVLVHVGHPKLTLAVTPSRIVIPASGSGSFTVTVAQTGGGTCGSGCVSLSASSSPSLTPVGFLLFTPSAVRPGQSATLDVMTSGEDGAVQSRSLLSEFTTPGTYSLSITAQIYPFPAVHHRATVVVEPTMGLLNHLNFTGLPTSNLSTPCNLSLVISWPTCIAIEQNSYVVVAGDSRTIFWTQAILGYGLDAGGSPAIFHTLAFWEYNLSTGRRTLLAQHRLASSWSPTTSTVNFSLSTEISLNGTITFRETYFDTSRHSETQSYTLPGGWGGTPTFYTGPSYSVTGIRRSFYVSPPQLDFGGPPTAGSATLAPGTFGAVQRAELELGTRFSEAPTLGLVVLAGATGDEFEDQSGVHSSNLAWVISAGPPSAPATFAYVSGADDEGICFY